jgi:hypothetical protein
MSHLTDNQLTAKALYSICAVDSITFRKQFKTDGHVNGKTLKDYVEKCSKEGRVQKAGGVVNNRVKA